MNKLLMSIDPKYVNSILAGTKRFEYRKVKCRRDIDSILIYATAPIKKVVAEVEVIDIIKGPPKRVWEQTSMFAGIEKSFYDKYYLDSSTAVAYALGQVTKYSKPLSLSDFGIKTAPQSFMYLRGQ